MKEGDGGTGKQPQQQKNQHEHAETEKWQDKTDDKQLARRDRWQAGKAWRDSIEMTKTVHPARHHLSLNDYFAWRTQRSVTWCSEAIPKGQFHQEMRKKITTKSDSWRAARKLGCFLIIISMFSLLVFSLKFISTFLFFWKSSDCQVGSMLPLTVPGTAFSVTIKLI